MAMETMETIYVQRCVYVCNNLLSSIVAQRSTVREWRQLAMITKMNVSNESLDLGEQHGH